MNLLLNNNRATIQFSHHFSIERMGNNCEHFPDYYTQRSGQNLLHLEMQLSHYNLIM